VLGEAAQRDRWQTQRQRQHQAKAQERLGSADDVKGLRTQELNEALRLVAPTRYDAAFSQYVYTFHAAWRVQGRLHSNAWAHHHETDHVA